MPLRIPEVQADAQAEALIDDTIAAISTPLGEGALAVIRLSCARSLEIADGIFKPIGQSAVPPSKAQTHTVHYGNIMRGDAAVD